MVRQSIGPILAETRAFARLLIIVYALAIGAALVAIITSLFVAAGILVWRLVPAMMT